MAATPSARALLVFGAVVFVLTLWLLCSDSRRRRESLTNRTLLPIGSTCQYTQRVRGSGAGWVCPGGSVDTKRTWGDPDGDKQCLLGCVTNPAVCQYRYRTKQKDGTWKCPVGWGDTGLDPGVINGERQCQQCPVRGDCSYTTRVDVGGGTWRCPEGTLDTGRTWESGSDGDKQCLAACCPSGYRGKNGGSSDLFACGPRDIERDGGIRRSSDTKKATELIGACCQWTNKDCRHRGLAGFFQNQKDQGITKTGYYTADDGCEVNVYDQAGKPLAVTGEGLGLKGLGIKIGLALAVTAISVGAAAFIGPAAGVVAGAAGSALAKVGTKQVVKVVGSKLEEKQKKKK